MRHYNGSMTEVISFFFFKQKTAYEMTKRRASEAKKQRDEIRGATREINTLKCEMHEIKDMLKKLLDRN